VSEKPQRASLGYQGGLLSSQASIAVGNLQQAPGSLRGCAAWRAVAWHLAARLAAAPACAKQSSARVDGRPHGVSESSSHSKPAKVDHNHHNSSSSYPQPPACRARLLSCLASQDHSQVSLALARKAWRAARVGLSGQPAYNPHQAAALLSSVARLGYHAPPSDLRNLLSLALTPLRAGGDHWHEHQWISQLAQVMWAAAHAARWSARHRRALTAEQASAEC
jgi:hypothetical protein